MSGAVNGEGWAELKSLQPHIQARTSDQQKRLKISRRLGLPFKPRAMTLMIYQTLGGTLPTLSSLTKLFENQQQQQQPTCQSLPVRPNTSHLSIPPTYPLHALHCPPEQPEGKLASTRLPAVPRLKLHIGRIPHFFCTAPAVLFTSYFFLPCRPSFTPEP